MTVDSATFERLPPDPPPAPWVLIVVINGAGFEERGAPLVAAVGDVPVHALRIEPDGTKLSGLLAQTPPEGARLSVGYLNDRELQQTEIEFHAPA